MKSFERHRRIKTVILVAEPLSVSQEGRRSMELVVRMSVEVMQKRLTLSLCLIKLGAVEIYGGVNV
jgi:hypothetical protein